MHTRTLVTASCTNTLAAIQQKHGHNMLCFHFIEFVLS